MLDDRSFHHLLTQLRAGDDHAAREVVHRFSRRLLALARRHLESWVRGTEDAEDVVQSVYQSFFARIRQGRFELIGWHDVWNLLTAITLHKCADRMDYARARRRHAGCGVSLSSPGESAASVVELIGREPTPLATLMLAETIDELFQAFGVADRPIVELSLQGYTATEISSRLGRAERTVRRVRSRIQRCLRHMQAADQGHFPTDESRAGAVAVRGRSG